MNMQYLRFWEASSHVTSKATYVSFMEVDTANTFILLSPVGRVWLGQHPLHLLHGNCITRNQTSNECNTGLCQN